VLVVLLQPANEILDRGAGDEHRAEPVMRHATGNIDFDREPRGEDLSRVEGAGNAFSLDAGKEITREEPGRRGKLSSDAACGRPRVPAATVPRGKERARASSFVPPRSILSTPLGSEPKRLLSVLLDVRERQGDPLCSWRHFTAPEA
jgi:hypothetical protein